MWRGLYIAASGMITETKHTDMIANNLANAATTGYKRDELQGIPHRYGCACRRSARTRLRCG